MLHQLGLVRYPRVLSYYLRFSGRATRLQAGRYLVPKTLSPVEIIEKIVAGDAVFDEVTVTIPEGWSLDDIEGWFEQRGFFSRDEFDGAVVMGDSYREYPLLFSLADDTILDGYLFPDTYRIFPDSTPRSVVDRMLSNFHRRISSEMMQAIESQGRSLHEVLTLASIVQKESGGNAEMADVAGVFWNRLRRGMRLESDATVNYVLGTSKLQPTFADTEVKHPYNTYERIGLPPGPIGNPGIEAIRAAIWPTEHDFLFFLHKPSREIVLSRTFGEHLRAKERYLD